MAAKRKLDIIVFNVQSASGGFPETHSESLHIMEELGFKVIPHFVLSEMNDIFDKIIEIGEGRDRYPYDIDGAVVKLESIKQRNELGSTSKAPKWAVAYKYPPEKKETILKDI